MSDTEGQITTNQDQSYYLFPLSYQQEALWFLDQLEPGLPVYNLTICQHIKGDMDLQVLTKALNILVERHESLRTGFQEIDEQVSQVIQKEFTAEINSIEIDSDYEGALDEAKKFAKIGFDLTSKSLLSSHLIKYQPERYILLFVLHHIVFDGWSVGIFRKELMDIYNALLHQQEYDQEAPEVQYADFAVWQRKWFNEETKERQLEFWKQALGDNPQPLELPTDKIRPARQDFKGGFILVHIPKEITLALKELSIKQSCTLFMTVMSAFKVLLHRYSGQDDISVGSPMANRQEQELENSLGYFVNTVVFRTDLSGNPTFNELLKRFRANVLDVFDNQDMPFDKLVEELKPERDLSRNPLFQAMLALQPAMEFDTDFSGASSEAIRIGTGTSKFDISFELRETSDGIKGFMEYNIDLFEPVTCQRMATNFQVLLQAIANNPEQRIGDLGLIEDAEKKYLLETINSTTREYPNETLLHQLVDEQAVENPDKVAVQFGDESITYTELIDRANQLAHYLVDKGAGSERLVGIYMNRGIDMVVGLLGILKSGSAYLPMDPMFPHDRLEYMLKDAAAPILLTQERLEDSFPDYQGEVICLDSQWGEISASSTESPMITAKPQNLAYTIYTSGSTGKPKGVQIEHRNVVNFLHSMQKEPGITPKDVLLSVTTLSFDISILEIFLPLITGAKLILVSKEQSMEGGFLLSQVKRSQVTIMQATPSTWRIMLDSGWDKKFDQLKVLCGGEAFPKDLADQLLDRCGELWNVYGPTETTIWSTCKQIKSDDPKVTIGRPIDNTTVYILDKNANLAAQGVIGELCIGGDGVSRGYLNRPELNEDRFISSSFNGQSKDLIYRTGDLARILNNGEIECLGRLDNQVKIRGYRIELGEIESIISQHPQIKASVVAVKGKDLMDSRLVAYAIPEGDAPSIDELKSMVKNDLPDYMVPAHWMFLEKFPKTSNEKIDRKNLPDPDFKDLQRDTEFEEAKDELENRLIEIWEKLLNVNPIGVNDNFFVLGGHSLLAARITAQIKKKLGIDLQLETLFKAQTVRELANEIRSMGWSQESGKAKKKGLLKIFKWS